MPILGVIASSNQQGRGGVSSAFDALAFITLNATTSTISFAGIPSGYRHLQIRVLSVTNTASSGAILRFNGDTTGYYTHAVFGSGSGTAGSYGFNGNIYIPNFNGGGATTGPGSAVIDILDYASNVKSKTVMSLDGYDANGSGYINLASGIYSNTTPITSITISLTSYLSGTQFGLYGVK